MFVSATTVSVLVMVRTNGFVPQSNVTFPPPASASSKAASVQLPGMPLPTTPPPRQGAGKNATSAANSIATATRIEFPERVVISPFAQRQASDALCLRLRDRKCQAFAALLGCSSQSAISVFTSYFSCLLADRMAICGELQR